MIPYGRHLIDDDDIQAVTDVLRNGPITQGEIVNELGQALADYTGADYGIVVSSGTAALQLSVAALDIGPGDEVITTPITFCATANVVIHQGADVRFVDIDRETLNIDPEKLEEKITSRTKAIMPVDFRGHPAALPEINYLADKHGLAVIEDASHALGSSYLYEEAGHRCGDGKHADLSTFSFHPVKHLTTGEGGAILTNNKVLIDKAKSLSAHGIERGPQFLSERDRVGTWIYELKDVGFNCRMTEVQAALGLSQLKKIEEFKSRRRQIVEYYNSELSKIHELVLPYESSEVNSNFHIYVLQIKNNNRFDRYDVYSALKSRHYEPMVHYIPIPNLSYYKRRYGFKAGDFPVAEKYYESAVTIPLYPSLSDIEIEKVVSDIKSIIENL